MVRTARALRAQHRESPPSEYGLGTLARLGAGCERIGQRIIGFDDDLLTTRIYARIGLSLGQYLVASDESTFASPSRRQERRPINYWGQRFHVVLPVPGGALTTTAALVSSASDSAGRASAKDSPAPIAARSKAGMHPVCRAGGPPAAPRPPRYMLMITAATTSVTTAMTRAVPHPMAMIAG